MRKKKNSKKWVVAVIAILTAIVGAFIAIGTYLKKKAEVVGENLDYDADFYDEEADYYDANSDDNIDTASSLNKSASPADSSDDNSDIGVLEDNDTMPDGKDNGVIV